MKRLESSFIQYQHSNWFNYHHNKESMAYSIFGLQGAFFVGIFFLGTWPPSIEALGPYPLGIIIFITWILFHTALRFQLRNRRLAAIQTAALADLMIDDEIIIVDPEIGSMKSATGFQDFIDTFLFPVRRSVRPSDAEVASLVSKIAYIEYIDPKTDLAWKYYQIKHRRDCTRSWSKYALPMELITSVGSILLFLIAELRVLQMVLSTG